MKILIVDDEELARVRLQDLLREIDPDFQVIQAENGKAALEAISAEVPDLVLMDIRMPVMDGLEAAYHLSTLKPSPTVVFTTAYQDHALAAFEANAVDYLLKPIRRDRLQKSLERARSITHARMENILEQEPHGNMRSFLVSTNAGRKELVPVAEIAFFKADGKYTVAGWRGREILIDEPLKSLETEFTGQFLRIHRNAMVAVNHIESLLRETDGSCSLKIRGKDILLAVSRRHLMHVRRTIRDLGQG